MARGHRRRPFSPPVVSIVIFILRKVNLALPLLEGRGLEPTRALSHCRR